MSGKRSRSRTASNPARPAKHQAGPRRERARKPWGVIAPLVVIAATAAIITVALVTRDNGEPAAAPPRWDVPRPDTSRMQPRVARLIEETRQVVERRLDSAEAWAHFGAVCDVHELHDDAATCYDRARRLAPSDFRWPYLLGFVRELQGASVTEVAVLFREAAELEPGFPPIFFRLGDALMREGKTQEAYEAYRTAIQLDPGLAIAHRSLGQVLNALGDHQAALVHLERAHAGGQPDGAVYAAIALAKTRLGDPDGAREAAELSRRTPIALGLPDPVRYEVEAMGISSQHCYDRAAARFQQGDYAGAIEQLEIAKEHLADDPDVQYLLGVAYARARQRLLAIQHLSDAIRLNPRHAGAHFSLGRVLESAGQVNEAIDQYRQAVAIDPDHAARGRLRALGVQR